MTQLKADLSVHGIYGLFVFFCRNILCIRWVVNAGGELGFRICGVNFWYYKWPDPSPSIKNKGWRVMEKREFGDVIFRK